MLDEYRVEVWFPGERQDLEDLVNANAKDGYELDRVISGDRHDTSSAQYLLFRLARVEDPLAWMSVQELAKRLKVSHNTVLELIYTRKIPAIKVGRAWKLPMARVEEWFQMRDSSPSRAA